MNELTIYPPPRLGVKTRVFHLGDYRRATVGPGQDVPDDYFFVNGERTSQFEHCEMCAEASDDGAFRNMISGWDCLSNTRFR